VLRGFRNGRCTAFWCWRGLARVTACQAGANQEDASEPTPRRLDAYAARDGGEPCAWIQVHGICGDGEMSAPGAPFRPEWNRPERTLIAGLRLGPLRHGTEPKTVLGLASLQRREEV
jgi:hypothetical protein